MSHSRPALYQDGSMYCPNCGTEVHGATCAVCGTLADAAGVGDAVTGQVLSGWWRRVGASIVDDMVLVIPTYVAFLVFDAVGGVVAGELAGIIVQGLYLVILLASANGQTVGNRMVGTQVRDALSGRAITTRQAVRRWGLVALYSAPGLLSSHDTTLTVSVLGLVDVLYPLMNARKQTWHDRFAGTIVVRR